MTEYCLGFAYCNDYANFYRVLLIRKTKPAWQAGHLNGIGGRVELTDPNPHWAMSREFKEECGLETLPSAWLRFAIMEFPDAPVACRVHVFASWWEWKIFKRARSTTEEQICHFEMDERFFDKMNEEKALPNLHWLVPMGLNAWQSRDLRVLNIVETDDRAHVNIGLK